MRRFCLIMLIAYMLGGCGWKSVDPTRQGVPRISIDKNGQIPAACVELKHLPYRERRMKCLGGKSYFNVELGRSKDRFIFPYGPVSRGMKHDLPCYCVFTRISFDRNVQRVEFSGISSEEWTTVFERVNDGVTVLRLSLKNTMGLSLENVDDWESWKSWFVIVKKIPPSGYYESVNMELDETECIVVFNAQGIYVKNSGDKKLRGYLFESSVGKETEKGEGSDPRNSQMH